MIKVFEMFSGYGGASFALKKARISHEIVGYSEIDKYAIQCYEQNHKGKNYGDCTKIDPNELPDFDLLTGGFPCQSFSVAGKGLGEQDTRGTLFHEIIRIAEVKKPKYMLLENVKGLTFKNHEQTFKKILSELDRIGYIVKWEVLNSKEHGIPQNRERVFFVCFRKDIENNFEFPQKEELKMFLKDILQEKIDSKYYLSEKQLIKLKEYLGKKNKINYEIINCVGTCFGRSGSSSEELESFSRINCALMIGNLTRYKMKSERTMSFKDKGVSWALTGNCDVGVLDVYNNKLKRDGVCLTLTEPHHTNLRLIERKGISKIQSIQWDVSCKSYNSQQDRSYHINGVMCCLPNSNPSNKVNVHDDFLTIRKLTPIECFRLMGFLDDEINLEGLSDTQRYKLAGNGWDINLVSKIFKNMFKGE